MGQSKIFTGIVLLSDGDCPKNGPHDQIKYLVTFKWSIFLRIRFEHKRQFELIAMVEDDVTIVEFCWSWALYPEVRQHSSLCHVLAL